MSQDVCSIKAHPEIGAADFCDKTFCPAFNAAWPLEMDRLCRPIVGPFFLFGDVDKGNESITPDSVKSFCATYKKNIMMETQGNPSGCMFSELYNLMKTTCKSNPCLKTNFACLAPESYCVKVGNEAGALAKGLGFDGDLASVIDVSKIKMYQDQGQCDSACLKDPNGGLPPLI
jgi:hypothetical protein